jgi:hypothetical protein
MEGFFGTILCTVVAVRPVYALEPLTNVVLHASARVGQANPHSRKLHYAHALPHLG